MKTASAVPKVMSMNEFHRALSAAVGGDPELKDFHVAGVCLAVLSNNFGYLGNMDPTLRLELAEYMGALN